MPWFAGNLHCHSNFSDGDSSPLEVANWYRRNGYSFISLTDHNCVTPTDEYTSDDESFVGISGTEFSANAEGAHAHVNGLGLEEGVHLPKEELSLVGALQFGVDQIHAAGGIAVVNHPTRRWAFDAETIKKVKGLQFFEVYNGTPVSNNEGDAQHDSTDEIWDQLLSEGMRIFGIASDDAHHYQNLGSSPLGFRDAPGTAWIWMELEKLSVSNILKALKKGDFLATTGVKLQHLSRSNEKLELEIDHQGAKKVSYRTSFIGLGGKILSQQTGLNPSYTIQGSEVYVRAKIESSSSHKAWVQPIFLA